MTIHVPALACSFLVILTTLLTACGGSESEDTSDAATRQALHNTNVNWPPRAADPAAPIDPLHGVLKRWSLPIPVKTNNEPRAAQAMDAIESRLGATIFDRTSIAGLPDDAALNTRGIFISVGTASGAACGTTVSQLQGANAELMESRISLDGAACTANVDVTIHEFGHALGMFEHFQNFGEGGPIGELFWRVLRTIYRNGIGTPAADIVLAP